MGSAHIAVGRLGEDRAAAWYDAHGYRVLARNWRCRVGEIDLVCTRDGTLVICEVKARRAATHGHPYEAVTPDKQRRLRRLAALYLVSAGEHRFYEEIRFDVVAILGSQLEVAQGAF